MYNSIHDAQTSDPLKMQLKNGIVSSSGGVVESMKPPHPLSYAKYAHIASRKFPIPQHL